MIIKYSFIWLKDTDKHKNRHTSHVKERHEIASNNISQEKGNSSAIRHKTIK